MMVLTCPGKMRALTFSSGVAHEHVERTGHVLVRSIHAEIGKPHRLGAFDRHGNERRGGFKADAYENDGTRGVFFWRPSARRGANTSMRMSRPAACSLSELVEPGTRVMSPKVVMIAFGTRESAITVSMSWLLVTHTGQPGPLARRQPSGMSERMPFRAMATVCVPHIHKGRMLGREGLDAFDEPACKHGSLKLFWSTMAATYTAGAGCTSSANSGNWRIRSSVSFAACSLTTSIANPACTNT